MKKLTAGENSPESFYVLLFDININLCDRFLSLDPFKVRSERFHDVLLIFRRLTDKIKREKPESAVNLKKTKNGKILRPAMNDDWY